MTPEQKSAFRKRNLKRRVVAYGLIFGILYGAFLWIPWEYDLRERKPETELALVDPDEKTLFAEGTKVLLVTAHPDDSEFYIGSTLHKLGQTAHIHQVIVTDGDKSYYGPFTDSEENRRVRHAEARAALEAWGGESIEFLGYPDGRLRVTDKLVDDLTKIIREQKPDYILGFDPEFPPRARHGDHRKTGVATVDAAKKAGFKGWMMLFSTVAPTYVVDVTRLWPEKEALLAIHESQFAKDRIAMIGNVVREQSEFAGARIGVELGEGFRAYRITTP